MSLQRVAVSYLADDDSLEVVTEDGTATKVGGGGSQPPISYLRLLQNNGQTFTEGGFASGAVTFDTVDGSAGTETTWDIGTPANVVLTKAGIYSYVATVEAASMPDDLATALFVLGVSVPGAFNTESPSVNTGFPPGGQEPSLAVAMPYFVLAAPGVLQVNVGFQQVSSDPSIDIVELVVAYYGNPS